MGVWEYGGMGVWERSPFMRFASGVRRSALSVKRFALGVPR
jgi:hypothetical protein